MTFVLYAFNLLVLIVSFAGAGFLAVFFAAATLAALRKFEFDFLLLSIFLLFIAAQILRLLAHLWKRNEDFRRAKPVAESAAALIPLLAIVVFAAGYGALRKFSEMVAPSNAKATVGNLGAIRGALSIYYGDLEGQYPEDLGMLTVAGKYIGQFPTVKTLDHPDSNDFTFFPTQSGMDTGTWGYVNDPRDGNYGNVFIDCTHTDPRGSVWTGY